jgi:hypothetical protein
MMMKMKRFAIITITQVIVMTRVLKWIDFFYLKILTRIEFIHKSYCSFS